VEDNAVLAAHCLRTLGHMDVRRWLGTRTHRISLVFDLVVRAVDLGLAAVIVMVARAEEWTTGTCRAAVPRGAHGATHVYILTLMGCHRREPDI
jgi:hypothetical protein